MSTSGQAPYPQQTGIPPGQYYQQGGQPQPQVIYVIQHPQGYPPQQQYYQGGYGQQPYGHGGQQQHGGQHNNAVDIEQQSASEEDEPTLKFSEKSIRRAFIRKVYSILMMQLLIAFGICMVFTYEPNTRKFAKENFIIFLAVLIAVLVLTCAMACCVNPRKAPMNYIMLFTITIGYGIILGFVAVLYAPDSVLLALGCTVILCFSLTLFSFQTKIDFTGCGVYLFVILLIFMIFSLIAGFFPQTRTFRLVMAIIGTIIFSFYLIYDTQLMIGGKHKYSISPEEYVFAALNLFVDIIQIFLFILQIVGNRDN